MLRIKNSVVLQELGKFGFTRYYDEDLQSFTEYKKEIDDIEVTIDINRIIYIWGEDDKCIGNHQLCIDEGLTPIYDLIQARISRKNRRKEVIGEMGEREYNLWLVLLVILKNSIAITCFTILAITFNIWWIALFSILFMSSVQSEKEDK